MSINFNKIHFIGIGGIGVSATARLMALEKKVVSGSDSQKSEITEELKNLGVKIFIGHNEKNLASDTNLVAHSLAIPPQNPELLKAKELKIPTLSYPEFLGKLMQGKFGIAVAGTNGKSTTTAMISFILEKAGLDPTVVIGSKLKAFKGNARLGKSEYFVAEADEYKRGFLNLLPKIAVITNIEEDHLDYYKNLEDIIDAFNEFSGRVKKTLIVNGDDKNVLKAIKDLKRVEILTFGQRPDVDLRVSNITTSNATTNFLPRTEVPLVRGKIAFKGESLGAFSLRLPGTFNVYNALGAIGTALHLRIPLKKIKTTLKEFSGLWRRFERVGMYKGALLNTECLTGDTRCLTEQVGQATIISDYAHHPTAIKKTIEAAREFYPKKRIITIFQPHQHSRTKKLFNRFITAFDEADLVILSEIFDVAGREQFDQDISSKDLAQAIRKRDKIVFYGRNLKETKELVLKNIKANDVVLVMGAGDIYKLANELAS